mgnify:CR=1 FL=1
MKTLKTAAILTSIFALTGCVGSAIEEAIQTEAEVTVRDSLDGVGSGLLVSENEKSEADSSDDVVVELPDFEEFYEEDYDDLGEEFTARAEDLYGGIAELFTTPYTDPTTLPTSGSASYDGLLSLGPAIGEMELIANFSEGSIGGTVGNVVLGDDTVATGSLAITSASGAIDRSTDTSVDFTFSAGLDGTLSDDTGSYDVEATMLGDFTDTDYGYVEGFVEGTVTESGSSDSEYLYGEFLGER